MITPSLTVLTCSDRNQDHAGAIPVCGAMPYVEYKGKKYIVILGEPHEEPIVIPYEEVFEHEWKRWLRENPKSGRQGMSLLRARGNRAREGHSERKGLPTQQTPMM